MERSDFKDHFSGHADEYAIYRPSYPDRLFEWLGEQSGGDLVAWDCATGNGQAAVGLANFFQRVIATDASSKQLKQARPHPRVSYRVEPAERSSHTDESVDLITVGQAYHWFDHPAFLLEADRVLRPGGMLAVWTYKLAWIEHAIDAVVYRLYKDIVGDYWPPERRFIDRDYHDFSLPWPELTVPDFSMNATWNLDQLIGYLGTWSALRRYVQDKNTNPLDLISEELLNAWGDPGQGKPVTWPLIVKACRKPG